MFRPLPQWEKHWQDRTSVPGTGGFWGEALSIRSGLAIVPMVAVLAGVSAPAALAESTPPTFDFTAESGAWPVNGRSGHWVATPDDEVFFHEHGNILTLDAESNHGFDYIRVQLSDGDNLLAPGTYQAGPEGPASIEVIFGSFGCLDDYGQFTVNRIERDGGRLTALDVTFEQHCGSPTGPALTGEAHFEA